ncbi:hypothetical protein K0504_15225 [Neiella marina]|uniref:Glycine cleavage system transcriptional repressor n=1 Tax=Neiella holothuriorum TaxID=2870530 RepID=A0ABS7EJI7_9GAMM|nr:ACT domain-containing protein [Neiella holothuriorum]MBW8192389.1 hypothetical protein [Neiella holothuriorum]
MSTAFIVSFAGLNRPNLLQQLAHFTHEHEGKWLSSKVNYLDGHIAANIKVDVPKAQVDAVKSEFANQEGLVVQITDVDTSSTAPAESLKISFHSNDRYGLVHDITNTIDKQSAELVHMDSSRIQVESLGTNVFVAKLVVNVPQGQSSENLMNELRAIDEHVVVDLED